MHQEEASGTWVSSFARDGRFCVAALRERIERASFLVCDGISPWIKLVPLKVFGFIWRAKQSRIPSAEALKTRGVTMDPTICGACNMTDETGDHILATCTLARDVLRMILHWCGLPETDFHSVSDIIDYASRWGNCPKKRNRLTAILFDIIGIDTSTKRLSKNPLWNCTKIATISVMKMLKIRYVCVSLSHTHGRYASPVNRALDTSLFTPSFPTTASLRTKSRTIYNFCTGSSVAIDECEGEQSSRRSRVYFWICYGQRKGAKKKERRLLVAIVTDSGGERACSGCSLFLFS
ncbi:unnamed protein product [Lactuca saligna]|uniref:Reverse transcriptase zinc-binding domain-containing protein n=1 Tax=Lactuca saligna TaxID=75948 RepID=A0AA35Y368_LACSI|nr:unnamed protein product [Lactuca saligna]